MKKITYFVAAAAVLASCNRNSDESIATEPAQTRTEVVHFEKADLPEIVVMNQSFGMSAKAAATQLNYTYRAFAEGPNVTGHEMQPSGIYVDGDMIFVTWHSSEGLLAPGAATSLYGSITAYKQTGVGQYTFTDRIDFTDADYHEVTAHRNNSTGYIEVFAVGQRNPANSGYLLSGHDGAVVTRVDYDYINDEFWEPGVTELPLPGVSANDIVAGASHLYVACGGGIANGIITASGVYEVDRSLARVDAFNAGDLEDVRALVADETTTGASASTMYVLDRPVFGQYRIHSFTTTVGGGWNGNVTDISDITGGGITSRLVDKEDLTWAADFGDPTNPSVDLIASFGYGGIYRAGSGANGITNVKNLGTAISTAYDPGLNVLYYCGEEKVSVLAMPGFNGGALVSDYDVIGEFTPPSGGSFVSDLSVKEMTVFQTRNIAVAVGGNRFTENGGVYFMQRDKN